MILTFRALGFKKGSKCLPSEWIAREYWLPTNAFNVEFLYFSYCWQSRSMHHWGIRIPQCMQHPGVVTPFWCIYMDFCHGGWFIGGVRIPQCMQHLGVVTPFWCINMDFCHDGWFIAGVRISQCMQRPGVVTPFWCIHVEFCHGVWFIGGVRIPQCMQHPGVVTPFWCIHMEIYHSGWIIEESRIPSVCNTRELWLPSDAFTWSFVMVDDSLRSHESPVYIMQILNKIKFN